MIKSIKRIDLKMFLIIMITFLIPALYTTIRIYFISNIPNDYGFNIASQLQWINVMIEVIQEALIFPLFFLIGSTLNNKDETRQKIISSFIVIFIIITITSLILGISANALTSLMNQKEELIPDTVKYIRLELIGIVFSNLVKFLLVIIIQKAMYKTLIKILSIQTILTIILDYILIEKFQIGVNAIAFTNIIVQASLLIFMIILISKIYEIKFSKIKQYINFKVIKNYGFQGGISGIESFVRNAVFIIMVLKIVNEVGEQGSFWVMMSFIWGWLLIPVLALGEIIKNDSSKSIENIENKFKGYFYITLVVVIIWIITIPLYKPFLSNVMGLENTQLNTVFNLTIASLIFYIIFAFNNIIDSICYGIGKIQLVLYQSLFVNIIYYGIMFILYKVGLFEPSLYKVAFMMAFGMLIDSIITFVMFKIYIKKEKIKIL